MIFFYDEDSSLEEDMDESLDGDDETAVEKENDEEEEIV